MDTANYARVNPLPSPATPISKVTGVHPRFLLGHQAHHKICSFRETTRCHSHLRYLEQPPTQRFPHHNHNPSLRLSPLGLMKSLQPSSQNVQHLKRSFKTVHTLEGFVHTPPPVMLTTSAQRPHVPLPRYRPTILPLRPQPSFPQRPPYGRPTSRDNYPCTALHPEDAQEPQRMKSILCAHLLSRHYNRLLDTLQAPTRLTALILSW